MFKKAKVKLTLGYLSSILLISIAFSVFVYSGVILISERALQSQGNRLRRMMLESEYPKYFSKSGKYLDELVLQEIKERTIYTLVLINLILLLVAGGLGYLLAGETLKPLETMLNKQKRFISDAAHEFKTPLTALKVDFEVTLRSKNSSQTLYKDTLKRGLEEVEKLSSLTEVLLKSSTYDRYQYSKSPTEQVDIKNLLEEISTNLKSLYEIKGIKLVTKLKSINIFTSRKELREVVTNILDNAVKYSPDKSEIIISNYVDKDVALIKVIDRGPGISKEDLTQIFEPFFRGDTARSSLKVNGFGMGLTIAKEIIEKLNGKIQIHSDFGKGTEVTISIPIVNSKLNPSL